MSHPVDPELNVPSGHPFLPEIAKERLGWQSVTATVRQLTADECMEPGYYADPAWSVRDVMAHLGTWLAEAQVQLERMDAGTYEGHDVDIDAMNAVFLEHMSGQPWSVAWVQAHAARTRMLIEWYSHLDRTDEAAWWIRKSGSEHYAEHGERLAAWADELIGRRAAEAGD
jgi:hypothetical protein